MEKNYLEVLEEKIRTLTKENAKLRKTNTWLSVFAVLILIASLWDVFVK